MSTPASIPAFSLERNQRGRLSCTLADGTRREDVVPVRAYPLAQVLHEPPPSVLHSNVAPASPLMVAVNDVALVTPDGTPVTVGAASGPTVSMVHDALVTGPGLPRASTWRARTTCPPSARPVRATGDAHAAQAAPSTAHSKVTPGSPAVMVSDAPVVRVGLTGI